jgi:CSLREA domain-containing protein
MKTKLNTGVKILTSILTMGTVCLAATLPVHAATFDVTTFSDELATNGQCSLREAIVNANTNAATYPDCPAGEAGTVATDVINLPAGTYVLSLDGVDERCDGSAPATQCTGTRDNYVPQVTYDASQGDLDITDDLTITGAGSDVTKIEWAPTSAGVPLVGDADPLTGDRIFQVSTTDATNTTTTASTADIASVVIQGLTLENGEVGLHPTSAYDVCVPDAPTLPTATHYVVSKTNAYDIDVIDSTCGMLDADGKLSATDTSVVIDQFRRMGGAIALGGGYATVHYDSKLEGQPPVVEHGGEGSSTYVVDHVTLNDVVVANSWSGSDGGGINSIVPATISQSKISGNTTDGNGGGLYCEANTTISDTLIGKVFDAATAAAHPELANRNYGENGGAIFFTGSPSTTLTILRSAINGNEGIGGAGIAAREAPINITNTTISKNKARDVGAGIITSGPVYLQNVTVADNLAETTAPVGGSGLDAFGDGTYHMSNTLLSNNKVEVALEPDKARLANCGCQGSNCVYDSQGYNLENGDTCNFDTGLHKDQVNTDPLLLALADNGGPTETQAITNRTVYGTIDSPAVDAGNNSNCPNNDQRSSIRPADGNASGTAECDIGAFEVSNFTLDLQISNMVAPDEVYKGTEFTVTTTILDNGLDDTNVQLVTSTLPANTRFVSAVATGGSVNTCAEAAGVVTCSIGDLFGTTSATVTLTLNAADKGDAAITASVSGTNVDDNPDNNSHTVTTTVKVKSSSGGGFCSYHPNGKFDPVLPGLVFIGLFYLIWNSYRPIGKRTKK